MRSIEHILLLSPWLQINCLSKIREVLKMHLLQQRFSLDVKLQNLLAIVKSTQFQKLAADGPYPMCKRQSEDEALASLVHEIPFDQFVPDGMWIVNFVPLGSHVKNYQKVSCSLSYLGI